MCIHALFARYVEEVCILCVRVCMHICAFIGAEGILVCVHMRSLRVYVEDVSILCMYIHAYAHLLGWKGC